MIDEETLQNSIEVLMGAAYPCRYPRHQQFHIMQALRGLMGQEKYDAWLKESREQGEPLDEGER